MIKPAIVIVAYNREDSLLRLLRSIENAIYDYDDIKLVISIDWSDNLSKVKACADAFVWKHGEKIIRTFDENMGLRKHVLSCGDLSEKYGAVIILEDDLAVAEDFYNYTVKALNYYENEKKIVGIALYSHIWNGYARVPFSPIKNASSVYIAQFSISWGQAWSFEQWNTFKKWYEKNQKLPKHDERIPDTILGWPETSWSKYFAYYMITNDKYYVVPYNSMTTNYHEAGVHSKRQTSVHHVPVQHGRGNYSFIPFEKADKYDCFFERMSFANLEKEGYTAGNTVIDLNGFKHIPAEKRYFLSSVNYNFPIVKSYGMLLRPIDENVDNNIPGKKIFLYDLKDCNRKKQDKLHKHSYGRVRYEVAGYDWRALFPVAINGFKRDLRNLIRRKFKI